MNFNSILKFLSYLTITLSVLMHDGIAHFRCEYDSYNIHEDFYHIIKSVSKEKKYFTFFNVAFLPTSAEITAEVLFLKKKKCKC